MKIHILFLAFLSFGTLHCLKNEAILYNQLNQQGKNITLSLSSDLKWKQFGYSAMSVCVSGLMLFYPESNFNGDLQYVFGGEEKCCTNLEPDSTVSSLRYPGALNDLGKDSITLYPSTAFVGDDKKIYKNEFNGFYARSLIVTGGSNWTVWDRDNYQGNSVCLVAPNPACRLPSFLVSPSDIPDFDHVVASGRKGCNPENTNRFDLSSFAQKGPSAT